jgi:hypothetical protein
LGIPPPIDDGHRSIGHEKGEDKHYCIPDYWMCKKEAIQAPPEKDLQWKHDGKQQKEVEREVRDGLNCYLFIALGSFRHGGAP